MNSTGKGFEETKGSKAVTIKEPQRLVLTSSVTKAVGNKYLNNSFQRTHS